MIEFKLFGMQIKIKFMFVAVITVFLIVDQTGISTVALLACMLHEFGHLIMFMLIGCTPKELSFELTGIRIQKATATLNYRKEVLVQLAGSATNFICFLVFLSTIKTITLLSIFAVTNLLVGVFNLLPVKNFDGGKLLELLLLRFFSLKTTTHICTIIDFICILTMLIISIYCVVTGGSSFTLLILSCYLMLTGIMKIYTAL